MRQLVRARVTAAALAAMLAMQSAPARADEPLDEGARSLRFAAGVALTGGGALGLLLGGIFGVRTFVDKGAIGGHCTPAGRCDVTGYVLGSEARDFAIISTITFTVGIAAAAAGTILIVRNTPKKTVKQAWITPGPGGASAGVSF